MKSLAAVLVLMCLGTGALAQQTAQQQQPTTELVGIHATSKLPEKSVEEFHRDVRLARMTNLAIIAQG